MDVPVEERFRVLCEITRAQHFAWREAALALAPQLDPVELTNKMWEITGVQTAKAYLKRLDREKPLAPQIAGSIVWSSQCMGEDAALEVTEGKDEARDLFFRLTALFKNWNSSEWKGEDFNRYEGEIDEFLRS